MKGRPSKYSNKELLISIQDIFWKKGYSATSLNDVRNITGTGAGSFYNTFKGGKKEVFQKAILQRNEAFTSFKKLLENSDDPIKLIKDFFKSIALEDYSSHMKGCIIVNSVQELTFIDDGLFSSAKNILLEVEEMYRNAIIKSRANGKILNTTDANVLAKYLISFWSGINVLRRLYPEKEILSQVIDYQLSILD